MLMITEYYDNLTFEHRRYVSSKSEFICILFLINILTDVKMQLKYRRKCALAMSLVSASQSVIINLGQITACFLAIYQFIHKISSFGDLVVLLSYWGQLHSKFS